MSDERLRATGLSRAKAAAARDLAEKTLARVVPGGRALRAMPDDEIVSRLVQVRGVGRWTVEMLLMSQLARPDVLPATDLGIRRGFARIRGLEDLPAPADLLAHGERWRPLADGGILVPVARRRPHAGIPRTREGLNNPCFSGHWNRPACV